MRQKIFGKKLAVNEAPNSVQIERLLYISLYILKRKSPVSFFDTGLSSLL